MKVSLSGSAVRRASDFVARTSLFEGFAVALEGRIRQAENELVVLTYHRVAPPDARMDLAPSLISVTPEELEIQIRWLRRRAAVLALPELVAGRARRRLPRRAMLLTFDDGYADFAEHAWPRLAAAGLPATLFLATAAPGWAATPEPGTGFWWDRLHAALRSARERGIRISVPARLSGVDGGDVSIATEDGAAFARLTGRLKTLSHADLLQTVASVELEAASPDSPRLQAPPSTLDWPAVRRLIAEGVSVAPHTRTHPLLTRVSEAAAAAEIDGSRADLVQNAPGARLDVFAYPSGAHSDLITSLLDRSGFELAFTTDRSVNRLGAGDRLRLGRFNVGRLSSPGGLAAQLLAASVLAGGRRRTQPSVPSDRAF